MADRSLQVGVLFRGNPEEREVPPLQTTRLAGVGEAFAAAGLAPEAVVYTEEREDEVRRQALGLDAVLVWVDPVSRGRNRNRLDELLREVSDRGVWVSSHPDLIDKLGTKELLVRVRDLPFGTDTDVYHTAAELRERLLPRLALGQTRALKPNRSNGGIGIRRVELEAKPSGETALALDALVRVQSAARGAIEERMPLSAFLDACEEYFDGTYAAPELVVDQPFQERVAEGMVRCYIVGDKVAGFGHQYVTALSRPKGGEAGPQPPSPRLYYGPSKPEFQDLKAKLEDEWLPSLCRLLELDSRALPALWDADFLYGPKTDSGGDTYVLCETNISAVLPFPDDALKPLAEHVKARLSSS